MYELIPEEVYESLPEDSQEKFVLLARTAQAGVSRLLDDDSARDFVDEIRLQFIETMRGVADALEIEGLPTREELSNMSNYEEYKFFTIRITSLVARARLKSLLIPRPHSVQLGRVTKARIRQEAQQLGVYIDESDLDPKRKKVVADQLKKLIAELDKERMSFAQIAAIAAAIATTVNQGASAVPRLPEAYQAVVSILGAIGEDKEREDAERHRLAPPPKALPSPPKKEVAGDQVAGQHFLDGFDDDIPF